MPRDLESEKATLEGMPPLSKETIASSPPDDPDPLPLYRLPTTMIEERFKKLRELNPYSLLLSQDDLEECDWLEHAAFEPHEAATRDKIDYRLNVCGDLCSGLFGSAYSTSRGKLGEIVRSRTFPSADSSDSDRKRVLLAHIIATKSNEPLVTDPSMDYPKDWRSKYELTPSTGTGHNEDGQTICLHSLCTHPDLQRLGLGRVLLVSYVQRIRDAGVAKRIALLCREKLIPFYEGAGFRKVGPSKCQYGGGNWFDMVIDFSEGIPVDDNDF